MRIIDRKYSSLVIFLSTCIVTLTSVRTSYTVYHLIITQHTNIGTNMLARDISRVQLGPLPPGFINNSPPCYRGPYYHRRMEKRGAACSETSPQPSTEAEKATIENNMVPYGHVWSCMVAYDPICSCLVLFCPVWSLKVPYGPL